jgi:multidrug efflux pump subunit AcrB
MRDFIAAFARNTVFANIVILIIFLAGLMAMIFMIRETFPAVELDLVSVSMSWPGADPEEVEEGVCRRIEEAIEGIDGIKEYHSVAAEQYGAVTVEVRDGYDREYVKERVRNAVEAISTFPLDAEKPVVEAERSRSHVMLVALYGEGLSPRQLKEWGMKAKEELRSYPEISQVGVWGDKDYEIAIEVSEERLREYGLTFDEITERVRANSLSLSGGAMRTQGEEIRLRTVGRRYTAEEFAKVVVRATPESGIITLDRVATIRDGFEEGVMYALFNGQPAVNLYISKTVEEDTLAIDRKVREYIAEQRKLLPEGMHMEPWAEQAGILKARISLLSRNGLIGLTLVFILLWLFLDIRLSFWAGMGMPISVMGALAIMWALGATINMISLFGLIMVLGIIVDDAIVVGEAIYVARKNGVPPLQAAVEGVMEVGMPVVAAVTTTIAAFIPLYFVGGYMGKFISILPLVVISCLAISLLECLVLLPAHLAHLPDFNKPTTAGHPIRRIGLGFHRYTNQGLEWVVAHLYEPFIAHALRWRYVCLSVAIAILLMTWGLVESGLIKYQFFPQLDGNTLYANVEFPNGTPGSVSERAVEQLESALHAMAKNQETVSGKPLIENVFILVGDNFGPRGRGSHMGGVRAQLLSTEERGIYSEDLLAAWKDAAGPITGAVSVTFNGESRGPSGGGPIEIWLQGDDMDQLMAASKALQEKLSGYAGVYQVQDDYRAGKNELRLRLKDEARTLGLTTADLARQISSAYFGQQAVRIQRGRDDIRVRVRYPEETRNRMADFNQVRIRTQNGLEVPIRSVAGIDYGPGYASIKRTNGKRRIAVTAKVNFAKANAEEIFEDLKSGYYQEIEARYPGVHLVSQGDEKENQETFGTLKFAYPIALLAIFIIIATIFRSYLQPLVIMFTVPFGIIGAVFGHLLMGYDLSIMSFFGMVALSGVVVNDAIVLIECINNYWAKGEPFYAAIQKGGARRFRAIFLTTVSTVGGLTPLMMEQDKQAQFLIPMAISIAAGVAFSTLLTLLLIPCLLAILNDFRRLAHRLVYREWRDVDHIEPARLRNLDLMEEDEDALMQAASPEDFQHAHDS